MGIFAKITRRSLSAGFTMVEITVAMGLLGLAVLGAVNLTEQVNNNVRAAEIEVAKVQFLTSLQQYLISGPGGLELMAQNFNPPTGGGSSSKIWQQLFFENWKVNGFPRVESGTKFKNFDLLSFEARVNPPVGLEDVKMPVLPPTNPITYEILKKNILTVMTVLKTYLPTERTSTHFIEVPVFTDTLGNIRYIQPRILESCATFGGIIDPLTGTCRVEACLIQGTFAVGGTYQSPNPYTGALSCPPDSTETRQTGVATFGTVTSCGKKCVPTSSSVTTTWYTCLKCP